jgi:hypothetical protein
MVALMFGSDDDVSSGSKPYIENGNKMTQHSDALKILILQLLLEKY